MVISKTSAILLAKILYRYEQTMLDEKAVFSDREQVQALQARVDQFLTGVDDDESYKEDDDDDVCEDEDEDEIPDEPDLPNAEDTVSADALHALPALTTDKGSVEFEDISEEDDARVDLHVAGSAQDDNVLRFKRSGKTLEVWTGCDTWTFAVTKFPKEWTRLLVRDCVYEPVLGDQ